MFRMPRARRLPLAHPSFAPIRTGRRLSGAILVGMVVLTATAGCGNDSPKDEASPASDEVIASVEDRGGVDPITPAPVAGSPSTDLAPVTDGAAAEALDMPDGSCPLYGAWQLCSVADRLERAGFVLRPVEGTVSQPGLDREGVAYLLGSAELQLYVYADSVGATAAEDRLDVREARPAEATGIRRPPRAIRSNNLLALMFNNNDRQLERVQLALAGGLPVH